MLQIILPNQHPLLFLFPILIADEQCCLIPQLTQFVFGHFADFDYRLLGFSITCLSNVVGKQPEP
jgi:hypothetical protein